LTDLYKKTTTNKQKIHTKGKDKFTTQTMATEKKKQTNKQVNRKKTYSERSPQNGIVQFEQHAIHTPSQSLVMKVVQHLKMRKPCFIMHAIEPGMQKSGRPRWVKFCSGE